jgi:hypothetical protein
LITAFEKEWFAKLDDIKETAEKEYLKGTDKSLAGYTKYLSDKIAEHFPNMNKKFTLVSRDIPTYSDRMNENK